MQIGSVLSRFSDPATFERRKDTVDGFLEKTLGVPASSPGGEAAVTVIREILQDYDVTDISPRGFSEMLQRLHQAGGLTSEQFQELSVIRLDLDTEGVAPEEPINLIDYYSRRLEKLERDIQGGNAASQSPGEPGVESVRQWVAWLEKFAMAGAMPEDLGWTAVA